MWSDHGTNFVGTNRILKEFLISKKTESAISDFCTTQGIGWHFIPEKAPHFGGLWEAAVKSFKIHLSRIVGSVKLYFEEMMTVLTQIEACMNSRPLGTLPDNNEDGIEMLTPGHFLIGRPLQAVPDDPQSAPLKISVLQRWHLCQCLVRHFWERWRNEYLVALRRCPKWNQSSENLKIGDVVVKEDNLVTCQWPLARVTETTAGVDGLVRVVTLKTKNRIYKRPVTKVAPLLPCES